MIHFRAGSASLPAPRGQRHTATVPAAAGKTLALLAATCCDRIETASFLEGPIESDSPRGAFFRCFVPSDIHILVVVDEFVNKRWQICAPS